MPIMRSLHQPGSILIRFAVKSFSFYIEEKEDVSAGIKTGKITYTEMQRVIRVSSVRDRNRWVSSHHESL